MIGQSVNMMYPQARAEFQIPRPAFEPVASHHHQQQQQQQQQQHHQESQRQFELAIRLQEAQRMRLINRQLERFQTLKTSPYEDNTRLFLENPSRTHPFEQSQQKNLDLTQTTSSPMSIIAPTTGNCFYTPPSSSASPISPPLPVQLEESSSMHNEIRSDGLVENHHHHYQHQAINESSSSTSSQAASANRRSSSIRNRPKRVRTIFTPEQLRYLEMSFADEIYISGQDRALLSAMLNLSEPQVKVWFQNRRIKHRKLTESQSQGITKGNKSFKGSSRPKKET